MLWNSPCSDSPRIPSVPPSPALLRDAPADGLAASESLWLAG